MRARTRIPYLCTMLIVVIAVACTATSAGWLLERIETRKENSRTVREFVDVRNCGTVEQKSIQCTAGASRDLTVGMSFGLVWTISGDVSSSLGIGFETGEELALPAPPEGFVYRYSIDKTFKVVTGNVLARSPSGSTRQYPYVFEANCRLEIVSRETLTCGEALRSTPTPSPTRSGSLRIIPLSTTEPTPNTTPEQAVRRYWELAEKGEYAVAWEMLSPGFRTRNMGQGFGAYVATMGDWMQTLCDIEVTSARLVSENGNTAKVNATIAFEIEPNCDDKDHNFDFYLNRSTDGVWLIDRVTEIR